MSKHTPEPWSMYISQMDNCPNIRAAENYIGKMDSGIPKEKSEANAARIVACVNALQGIPDPAKTIPALIEAAERALSSMTSLLHCCQASWDDEGLEQEFADTERLRAALKVLKEIP